MHQAEIPATFNNLWQVSGWIDEHPHAQKVCEVLGYTVVANNQQRCRVRFVDRTDLFQPETALIPPHMLFPVRRSSPSTPTAATPAAGAPTNRCARNAPG